MSKPCIIYGLASTADGEIRYVGQTTQTVKRRLAFHVSYAKRHAASHLDRWINKVARDGFKVNAVVLDGQAIWNITEVSVIAKFRSHGASLLNIMAGGQGSLGWKKSDDERRRISASKIGHAVSEETRQKIRDTKAANPARWSEARRIDMSAKMKNRTFDDEHKAKISAAKLGHSVPEETRQKIRATLKARFIKAGVDHDLHA
jgi:hypothetical protein